MTVVEKAAYLKGLTEGLGVDPASREGKLWGALNDLLADLAHEVEDLRDSSLDFADVIDEIGDELAYLEEITCDLDSPEDFEYDDEEDEDIFHPDLKPVPAIEEGDEELTYDGVIYDVTCPACGEEISFEEETLEEGFIICPSCGEKLEFELDD